MAGQSEATRKLKNKAKASLTLLLVAVISITTATYAWFSLSNTTVVQDMTVQVGTGTVLRAATAPSADLDDYKSTLTNDDIEVALKETMGTVTGVSGSTPHLDAVRLWPLTSGDGKRLYTYSSNSVAAADPVDPKTRYYMEVRLWFMTDQDMNVYLNGQDSPNLTAGEADGTLVQAVQDAGVNSSNQKFVDQAVRISFAPYALKPGGSKGTAADYTVAETPVIYEPNKNGTQTHLNGNALTHSKSEFKVTTDVQQTFENLGDNVGRNKGDADESPVIFTLEANVPKLVVMRIWIEGEDAQCLNDAVTGPTTVNIEKAKLLARFRFCGADDDGNYIETGSVS